jgi:integrase
VAARTKEYIDRLIVYSKVGSSPDVTIQKWLAQLPIEKHQKLSDVGLVKARSRMTLGAILDDIVAKHSDNKNTYDIYRSSKERLIAFFGADRQPETITKEDAIAYKEFLKTRGKVRGGGGYSQNTVWKKLQQAGYFFTVMQEDELILRNPFAKVKEPPTPESNRKCYIPAEYCLTAMEFAPTLEWKVLIALWRFLGLRRASEPLRLRWADVDWDNMLIRVYASKTSTIRYVPIFDEVKEPLRRLYEQTGHDAEWVINDACPKKLKNSPNRQGSSKDANLYTRFNKICRKAGLKPFKMAGNNMRASCVKDIYSGKYPELRGKLDRIMQMFGHTPETAMRYYRRFCRDDYADVTSPISSSKTVSPTSGIESEKVKIESEIEKSKSFHADARQTENETHFSSQTSPCENLQDAVKTGSLKILSDIQAVKNPVKQGEKPAYLTQGITSPLTKVPRFHAPDATENKRHNSKYTPQDSNL